MAQGATDGSVPIDDPDVNLVLTISYTVKAAIDLQELLGISFILDAGDWDTLPPTSLTQAEADALIELIEQAQDSAETLLA